MGVCRGRISEGLDFSDNAARCVCIVGIPYPQSKDPKVILKKEYLDARQREARMRRDQNGLVGISGKDWYNIQATRSVNQAIGRVIRHVQDFGSILLIDSRFAWPSNRNAISKWLRDRIKIQRHFGICDLELNDFYKLMAQRNFKPKVEQLEQLKVDLGDGNDQDAELGQPLKIRPSKQKGSQNSRAQQMSTA